ncbi:hypothetical protein OEZ86_006126 [Tetradesmus obliquus]|nr:hypothetical protein OEZ86_006126 [Tetradesmus obliquus]
MFRAARRLAVLLLLASAALSASARPSRRALLQDGPVPLPAAAAAAASPAGVKTIVNNLRMISQEESNRAVAALDASIAAAAADSDTTVSISRASAMTPQQNQAALDTHNKYRAWHQVGALAWSDVVATAAMDYASRCIWQHDPNNQAYGENLYATTDKDGDLAGFLQAAVDGWYSEVTNCNFAQPEGCFNSGAGHLTQLIWKGSNLLGCAAVKCNSLQGLSDWTEGGTIVVCRYNPPGNVWGKFTENIFPRSGSNPTSPQPPTQPPTTPTPSPSPELPQNPPPQNPSPSPSPNPSSPPPAGAPRNFQLGAAMQAGWFISSGSGCMSSSNKQYRVCITGAGNVTVQQMKPRQVLWASNTKVRRAAEVPAMLWLNDDNVLSVVGKSFSNLGFSTAACPWCARSKSALVMQDDGNLVLYGSSTLISSRYAIRVDGRVLWQTATGVPAGSKRN